MSSLSSIIEYLGREYDIDVLALSHDGYSNSSFRDKIIKRNIFLHANYCNYLRCKGLENLTILPLKTLLKVCKLIGLNIERFLCKFCGPIYDNYDTVIAFQEGSTTRFVSYIDNAHKLAWVHCDYKNYSRAGLELQIYNKFHSIICVSQFTASTFISVYPSLDSKVISIHNLMNTDRILKMSEAQICDARFDNSLFTIISIGRIDKVKRFEFIPEIASWLKQKGCQFRWYIIGPGVCQLTYDKLQNNIKTFNVEENVIYVGSQANPYPYLRKANLLVSLSYTEACPMIFNEAKVLNLPIVTTDFGSAYEFVEDGVYGLIAPFQKLKDTIENVIIDNSIYEDLKSQMNKVRYNNDKILAELKLVLTK